MSKIFISSVMALLVIFVVSFVLGINSEIAHSPAGWDGALLIASVAAAIGVVSLVFWGIPIHLYLSYKRLKSVYWYLLAGLVPAPVLIFVFRILGKDDLATSLVQVAFLGSIGSIASVVFWYFVRGESPRDENLS